MYRGKRISVVIPCHNEEDGIAAVMAQMPPIIDEVVVVDNNSTDRTAEVAAAAGGQRLDGDLIADALDQQHRDRIGNLRHRRRGGVGRRRRSVRVAGDRLPGEFGPIDAHPRRT